MNRLETALRRGPEAGITFVCVAPHVHQGQVVDAFAARLAFGMPESSPDECSLSIRGQAEITLKPVEVRRRAVAPAVREHNGVQQPEFPVADTEPPLIVPTDNEVKEPIGRTAQTTTLEADGSREASSAAEPAEAIPAEPVSGQSPLITVDAEEAEAPQAGATGPIFWVCCFGTSQVQVNGREITEWSFQKAGRTSTVSMRICDARSPCQELSRLRNTSKHLRSTEATSSSANSTNGPMSTGASISGDSLRRRTGPRV